MPAALSAVALPGCSNVFMTFAVSYMHQPVERDCVWAGRCILGAVYFIFRG
jgi:uncharacterized protein (DUF486 family)